MGKFSHILEAACKDPQAGCGEYKGGVIGRNTKSVDKKNKISGHEWTEQEWAGGYTVSGIRGIGCLEVFRSVKLAKEAIDFYTKFPMPEPVRSAREIAKAKKLGLVKEAKVPELKIWNGHASHDMRDRKDPRWKEARYIHVYFAAYSAMDAAQMIAEYTGQADDVKKLTSYIRRECSAGLWGTTMKDITPERGMWVQFGDHVKPVRVI